MKHVFDIREEYWQCGDGCCSDSWINFDYHVEDKGELSRVKYDERLYGMSVSALYDEDDEEEARKLLLEQFDLNPEKDEVEFNF